MPGAFSKEQKLRRFLKAKKGCAKEVHREKFGGGRARLVQREGAGLRPGHLATVRGRGVPHFPEREKDGSTAWESGERFVGLIVSRRVCMGLRWAHPSWCYSQAAPV